MQLADYGRRRFCTALALASAACTLRLSAATQEPMLTRPVPSTGELLPAIGLGTADVFDVGTDAAARAPLAEVLRALLDAGGALLDTSPMYGRAEAVAGDLVESLGARPRMFIATKVWTRGKAEGLRQIEDSMRLLKTPRLDLVQVHNLLDLDTQLATVRELKAAGRVRHVGVTHYTQAAHAELAGVLAREPLDFVQLNYSVTDRGAEERLLPLAMERGVAVLVNRPFEDGALFRRVRGKALPPWASEFDCSSWAQFFLKFVLGHPAVTCVIPATSRVAHMIDNAAAGSGRLPDPAMRARMVKFIESL